MTLNEILHFLLCVIATEAITELITKSEIFKPLREFFFNHRNKKLFNWIHDLATCGYCTSVWVGWFVVSVWFYLDQLVNQKFTMFMFVKLFFIGLVFHRLSNMLHFFIDWLNERRGQGNS